VTGRHPRAVVTNWVHAEVLEYLSAHADVMANDTREPWSPDEVRARAREADGLMAFMPDRVDDAFLAACPRLRIVACALKGYDNFDVEACTRRGVWLTVVPDLLTVPTAELAVALLLAVSRHVLTGDRGIRSAGFRGWRPRLYGRGLAGSTVGLVGMGKVGRAIAERLAAFQPRMVYHEEAVADALADGRLAGYAADVFEMEDWARPDHPPAIASRLLADERRTVFTPHLGSAVDDARRAIALAAAHDLVAVFDGRPPEGAVNQIESTASPSHHRREIRDPGA
jgi:lactate dehydrogenase-like 2-hydroxyacid dehydrogenase